MRSLVAAPALFLLLASPAWAGTRTYALPEDASSLREGPGVELARNACLSCHSADYVTTQPPRMGANFWQAVVAKMIKAYHAQISESDANEILEYLSRTY